MMARILMFLAVVAAVAVLLNRPGVSGPGAPGPELSALSVSLDRDRDRLESFYTDHRDPEPYRRAIAGWAGAFRALCEAARKSGAEPVVVLVPSIEPTLKPFSHVVNEEAGKLHVAVLDLQQDFIRFERDAMFFPGEGRLLTRYGHFAVAAHVERHLRALTEARRNGPELSGKVPSGPLDPSLDQLWDLRSETFRVRTNAAGFRMRAEVGPVDTAVQRILCLGDEHTFGAGVSAASAWPAQLRSMTKRDVINAGSVTGGMATSLDYFTKHGVHLGADLVLIQVQANDFLD